MGESSYDLNQNDGVQENTEGKPINKRDDAQGAMNLNLHSGSQHFGLSNGPQTNILVTADTAASLHMLRSRTGPSW